METLREAYNRIIEDYDPYYIPDEEPTDEEMLYNLRELLKDFTSDPDKRMTALITQIKEILEKWEDNQ